MADAEGRVLIERSFILKPEGFEIPSAVAKIHGISQEIALANGVSRAPVFREYLQTVAKSTGIVAHNSDFDMGFVHSECDRLGLIPYIDSLPIECTMRSSTAFCQLAHPNGRRGFKWPKLEELHYKLFKTSFSGAHNALVDVQITMKCYFELKRLGVM